MSNYGLADCSVSEGTLVASDQTQLGRLGTYGLRTKENWIGPQMGIVSTMASDVSEGTNSGSIAFHSYYL